MKSALIAAAGLLALEAGAAPAPTGQLAGCHADAGARARDTRGGPAPRILPGLGDAGYDVERATPAARAQFGNGVRLNNAFNEPEAIRAFQAAERLDPKCALCFWGEAAARAPTINYPIDAAEAGRAVAALDRAQALSAGLSPKAHGVIEAERARYVVRRGRASTDAGAAARAADALAERFPTDDALQVAAADARIILAEARPDGFSGRSGTDGMLAQARLERVLARSPRFTPALHFHIHLEEWLGSPKRAEGDADALGALAPAAGHLVHMPSHIYYRVGRFEDAAAANLRAADADAAYVAAVAPPGGIGDFALHAHNLSFGLAGALMSGDGPLALEFARRMRATYPAESFVSARSYLADGRYAPPAAVLALPAPRPAPGLGLALAYRDYARGEARARLGDPRGVRAEAAAIADLQRRARANGLAADAGTAVTVEVGRLVLLGRALMLERNWRGAADSYRRAAVLREAKDTGVDPPLWGWPPRRSLAAALLAGGDPAGARREAAASLVRLPGDGAALHVLAQAQAALHDPAAARTAAEAARAWRGGPELLRLELI